MELNKKYYVYQLIDPRNNQAFYVGKGSGNRMYLHERYVWKKREWVINPQKCQTIKDILAGGHRVVYTRVFFDTEDACLEEEKRLIKLYGKIIDNTGHLTNLTDGGEGQSGKTKWVYQYQLNGEYVQKYKSPLEAATRCKIHVNSIQSAAGGKQKSAGGYMWCYHHEPSLSPYFNFTTKKVKQYTKSGEFVREYNSVRDAANATNVDSSNIISVCRRHSKNKTAGGYLWRYVDDTDAKLTAHRLSRPVLQYTKTGEFITEYNSVREAAELSGANNIVAACKGERKSSGGYIWRYKQWS